jgi:hypothetical protein
MENKRFEVGACPNTKPGSVVFLPFGPLFFSTRKNAGTFKVQTFSKENPERFREQKTEIS